MAESSETSRKRRRASEHDIFQSHSGKNDVYQSHSGHHDIFLSYSGAEKPFVEQLFHDLERAGQHPFFDQDLRDSLPRGEMFPTIIFEAASQCQIGVVVLSKDYLTSKWPMLELSEFVESMKTSNPKLRLLPLYFKLSPSDLSDKELEMKWKPVWTYKELQMNKITTVVKEKVESWTEAVRKLRASNGLEFAKYNHSEYTYREDVVREICKLLPSKRRIFLSHSGKQKPFVEQLFEDLKRVHQDAFFDKDSDSLPKAERFAPNILEAAEQCQMGVVVLSEDYLTSYWPMLELSKFVESKKTNNPTLRLFPIFFKLSPDELKEDKVESRWKPAWRNIVRKDGTEEEVVTSWSEAVKALRALNGLKYTDFPNSEYKYRTAIVKEICKEFRPILRWRTDHIQGYERLCEVASSMFKDYESRKYLGLYGMAGVGKSTLCKAMCNYSQGEFGADVCYVELGNDEADDRLARLKEVLRHMLVDSSILNYLGTEEQGWECLRMTLQDKPQLFLAIDNVGDSESSKEEARSYLGAKLPDNSMVLVTSRSKYVLEDVLGLLGPGEPIPHLQDDEAINVFLSYALPGKSFKELNNMEMFNVKACLTKCQIHDNRFGSPKYHPLLLKAIGMQLRNTGFDILIWSEILEGIEGSEGLKEVNSILGKSYEPLSKEMKLIFLDTVLYPHHGYAPLPWWSLSETAFGRESLSEKLCLKRREDAWSWVSWISEVHGVTLVDARMMLKKLQRLALFEVSPTEEATIQSNLSIEDFNLNDEVVHGYLHKKGPCGEGVFGKSKVLRMEKPHVHNLFKEFAKGLVEQEGSMEWKWWMSREELGVGEVPKLKRVVLEKDMPSIGHPPRKLQDWRSLTLLELIDCSEFGPNNILDLGGLSNLRVLAVDNCRGLKGIVSSCNNGDNNGIIQEDDNGGCISHLTSVMLQGLASLVDMSFLDHNRDIQTLRVMNCNGSVYPTSDMNSGIMNLRILKKLHTLIVWDCVAEVDEANVDTLILWLCSTLRLQELLAFEYRVWEGCRNLQQVIKTGKDKKNSGSWNRILSLEGIGESKLSVLSLCLPKQIKFIQGLRRLSELEILNLSGYKGLIAIPDLQHCTKLKHICAHGCYDMDLWEVASLEREISRKHRCLGNNMEIPLNGHSFEAFLLTSSCGRNMKDFSYMEVEHECLPGSKDGRKMVCGPRLSKQKIK